MNNPNRQQPLRTPSSPQLFRAKGIRHEKKALQKSLQVAAPVIKPYSPPIPAKMETPDFVDQKPGSVNLGKATPTQHLAILAKLLPC